MELALLTFSPPLDVDTLPSCEVALAALAAGIKNAVSIMIDKIKIINFFIATSFLVTLKAGKNQGLCKKPRLRGYFGDFCFVLTLLSHICMYIIS